MRFTKVGLTGGIASGKSSVAGLWHARGAAVIDSDRLAHRTLEPGTPTHAEIVREFGTEILNADGSIHRPTLGGIVFGNERRRQVLNQIVHPVVRQMWGDELAAVQRAGRTAVAVVAIPLLFEVGVEEEFDCVVVVACSEQTQLARLAAKGLDAAQARARIASQLPPQAKMDRGDFVVWNDGSLSVLERQAAMIWSKIKEN